MCQENKCIDQRLRNLHQRLLDSIGDKVLKEVGEIIDSYIVPCAVLKRFFKKDERGEGDDVTMTGLNHRKLKIGFECFCKNPSHTLHMSKKCIQGKNNGNIVKVPLDSLFLLPQDSMRYENLPDLGFFIRATINKKYFNGSSISNYKKIQKNFSSKSYKQGINQGTGNDTGSDGLNEYLCNSLCVSILYDSIPCLSKCKRGVKYTTLLQPPLHSEVQACVQIMYGTLLKLYPRCSKTPTFNARVNMAYRIQDLSQKPLNEQIDFVQKYHLLVKICFMEYCHNVLNDFLPAEHTILSKHPCMKLYEVAAEVMFDTFRRDVVVTGLEPWDFMEAKAAVNIERCMRMCKFKLNRAIDSKTRLSVIPISHSDFFWDMKYAGGDMSVLSKVYDKVGGANIRIASLLQGNIMTYALPKIIQQQQANSMERLFGACSFQMNAIKHFCICAVCCINKKGFRSKLRMCGLTGIISCDLCQSDSILQINMLGVVLRICDSSLYMCPTCCKITLWRGDGTDLHRCCCDGDQMVSKQRKSCSACNSKYVSNGPHLLPDVVNKRMARVSLCNKHTPAAHVMSFVNDFAGLQMAVSNIRR